MSHLDNVSDVRTGMPLISVLVAAYNAEKFIAETLEGIFAQTYPRLEVIVVDDCSADKTMKVLETFVARETRLSVYQNAKNFGVATTRNTAFSYAKGTLIAICDADDVWLPDKLEKQFASMTETDADFVYTAYSFMDENSDEIRTPYLVPDTVDYDGLLLENVIGCSTVLMKRELWEKFPMDGTFYHEDYSMWLKILRNGYHFVGLTEPLVRYRILEGSRSASKLHALWQRAVLLRKQEKRPLIPLFFELFSYGMKGLKKHR